ncbi:VanZ family protein [Photobacterium japonica]|uniref:VanZ family protein n=1 Tax=Photobacterium japonica TaxID=2910235 RepID=UPI003D0DDE14
MPPSYSPPLPKRRFWQRTLRWTAFISYAIWVGIISLGPAAQTGDLTDLKQYDIAALDKILHFGVYGLFTCLGFLAVPRHRFQLCCLLLALYGAGLEYLQGIDMAGREASWADGAANVIGVIAGYYSLQIIERLLKKQSA